MILVSAILLSNMSISRGHFLYVCLWLDHYLHQYDKSGPMGSTWLGGVATYTTTRDQCIEMVPSSSMTISEYFHLVLQVPEYDFL